MPEHIEHIQWVAPLGFFAAHPGAIAQRDRTVATHVSAASATSVMIWASVFPELLST